MGISHAALRLSQRLHNDLLCSLSGDSAKLLGSDFRNHSVAHLVTLFYFPRFFERDFLFGVLYGLHDVFVRAYPYPALFGIEFKLYVHCLAEILFAGKRQCVFERGNKNALIDSLFPFKVIKCRKKILVNHFPVSSD